MGTYPLLNLAPITDAGSIIGTVLVVLVWISYQLIEIIEALAEGSETSLSYFYQDG